MAKAHCMALAYDPTTNAILTSATVNVYDPGTVSAIAATIYDKNGGTLSNPLTSDATTGLIDFYLSVAQDVDLVVSKNGFTTRTYSNVPVLDDAGNNLTALLTTTGDILYASADNTPARLAIGTSNQILTVASGIPSWIDGFGGWTTWTPIVIQGASTPTLTVNYATYLKVGKLMIVSFDVSLTSAGTTGNDIRISNLPVAPKHVSASFTIGMFSYARSGTGTYFGTAIADSGSQICFQATEAANGHLGNTNGPAFAVANNDVLSGLCVYEVS